MTLKILEDPLEIYDKVIDIINQADKHVFLITPFIKFETQIKNIFFKRFKEAINNALNRNIEIDLIIRIKEKSFDEESMYIRRFLNNDRIKIFTLNNLHAKIYCNEKILLLTSMNLYLSSLLNMNKEIGILIEKMTEKEVFKKILDYIKWLEKISNFRYNE